DLSASNSSASTPAWTCASATEPKPPSTSVAAGASCASNLGRRSTNAASRPVSSNRSGRTASSASTSTRGSRSPWPQPNPRRRNPHCPSSSPPDRARTTTPDAEAEEFFEEYYPQLRASAEVVSTDESVTFPAHRQPRLVVFLTFGAGDKLDVSWYWEYSTPRRSYPVIERRKL